MWINKRSNPHPGPALGCLQTRIQRGGIRCVGYKRLDSDPDPTFQILRSFNKMLRLWHLHDYQTCQIQRKEKIDLSAEKLTLLFLPETKIFFYIKFFLK